MAARMRAAVIDAFGAADQLVIRDVDTPEPGPEQLLIEVHAAGINPIDWKMREGQMAARYGSEFPMTLGFDCSGVVTAMGADVNDFAVGDEVFARSDVGSGGCYAEYVVLNARTVVKKPSELTHEEAASIPLVGLTALIGLRDCAQLETGQRILIIGASGGVGTLAVQIARNMGATHITGVCSDKNSELVGTLGVDQLVDYNVDDPFATETLYDIIYDTIGVHAHLDARRALTESGTYLTLVPVADIDFFIPGQTDWEPGKGYFVAWAPSAADLEILADWVEAGQLRTVIDSTFSLKDIREAHLRSETERAVGKIVIRVKE